MDARMIKVADAILERGVRFRLPASFVSRLLKRDIVIIRHLKPGTILEISRVIVENKMEEALLLGMYEQLLLTIEPISRCIAIAILNDKKAIEKKADALTRRLLWKVSADSLIELFVKISVMNRVSDFTSCTKFMLNQTQLMMSPRGLGRKSGS